MTKLVRVIDMERCMGCRSCVAACHVENHLTIDAPWNMMIEREVGQYPYSRMVYSTMNCMHCEQPACKKACDAIGVQAISKNELGVVNIDYDKCIGCGYCFAVCPYGVPQETRAENIDNLFPGQEKTPYEAIPNKERHPSHRKKNKTYQKCTFCSHKLDKAVADGKVEEIGINPEYTPSCDLVCPVSARHFGDLDNPKSEVNKIIGEKKAARLKEEYGTHPQVFYVLEGGDY